MDCSVAVVVAAAAAAGDADSPFLFARKNGSVCIEERVAVHGQAGCAQEAWCWHAEKVGWKGHQTGREGGIGANAHV